MFDYGEFMKEEGRVEGREEGRVEAIRNLMETGWSIQKAMSVLKIPTSDQPMYFERIL